MKSADSIAGTAIYELHLSEEARKCEESNRLRLATSRDHWRNLALVLVAALACMAAMWILREVG